MTPSRGIKYFLICFLLIATNFNICAQGNTIQNDTLKRLINASLQNEAAKLFVHYDKTTYLPNETIWFTAYLLNDDTLVNKSNVLSVALIKNNDRSIAVQKKFVVTGPTSSGSILVPDSVLAGDYSIVAYTGHFIKEQPGVLFTQRIAIKRVDEADVKAKVPPAKAGDFTSADSARINVKFYPEGGDLVANLPAYVGWEAKDGTGAKLKLKAVLLKDGEFIDTVKTSASGMGRFFINPKPGSKYTLAVPGVGTQSTFNLPLPVDNGVALTVPSAVVHDTLVLKVAATLAGHIHIVVHNTRRVFYALTNVDPQKGKIFKIALDSLPRGLAAVTVYNENMRPCAERIFFAHDDKSPALTIVADQAKYGKRKKVVLHLNFNSRTSKQGLVSVACVRTNRIDRKNFNDIESFAYLEHSLNNQPFSFDKNGTSPAAKKYLEDVLLVRGWRRFIANTSRPDYLQNDIPVRFLGTVTFKNKPLRKPKMLMLFGDSVTKPVLTDSIGRFEMTTEDLLTLRDKKLTLMATGDDTDNILIVLNDPYVTVNKNIANSLPAYNAQVYLKTANQDDELSLLENKISLKQVTIKASKGDEYYTGRPTGPNKCGDYVCVYKYLNCPSNGHEINSHPPVKGVRYLLPGGGTIVYQGCMLPPNKGIHFYGININKEFYPYREEDITISEPLYENTLLWKNQIQLEGNKEATLTFYTGDVKAGFTVIAQGITDNGVLFGEQHFEVE